MRGLFTAAAGSFVLLAVAVYGGPLSLIAWIWLARRIGRAAEARRWGRG